MLDYSKISRVCFIVVGVLLFTVMSKDTAGASSPNRNTQSWTDPNGTGITISFSTPAGPSGSTYADCTSASDLLYTTGVPSNWTLQGYVHILSGYLMIPGGDYPVSQPGNLNLTVFYPPFDALPGSPTKTINTDLAITVRDASGTPVSWVGPNGTGVIGPGQNWTVECLNPPVPALSITKYTNGLDANNPNGSGVPILAPGSPVAWTYQITNIGSVPVAGQYLSVTDNQPGVKPLFNHVIFGNGDQILDPGEVWQYAAGGSAFDLSAPPQGVFTVANSCTAGKPVPPSTAYVNTGTVTYFGQSPISGQPSSDPSSYCNPQANVAAIIVKKYLSVGNQTNWVAANTAPGPIINVNTNVFFKFEVTNIGSFALSPVTLTDNTYSTSSCVIPGSLAVGASFSCVIGPFPAQSGQHTNTVTVTGNNGGTSVTDHDTANYLAKNYYWLPLILK